ncbi:putative integrase/recombinase protein [Candidatus Burkholderia brachyanthoides]|nr:putative integrase/recombinase protein [Candidatus Burkholderia brachyanthoides]
MSETWLDNPEAAYAQWQRESATGADRRAFADQSIVQHLSMFGRFNAYLVRRGHTVANFGRDHLDGFFSELVRDCGPGTTTRLRYLKLIDRLVRHLVNLEIRTDNPAAHMLARESWPDDEPTLVYLSPEDDERLQRSCAIYRAESFKVLRNVAAVALLLATGLTGLELTRLQIDDLLLTDDHPSVFVKKHGPRLARRVPINAFATDLLRRYLAERQNMSCKTKWLFVATATGKPLQPDTLARCTRAILRGVNCRAADESPRMLRNTFGRRQILAGKTNEELSNLLGLFSHRTAVRLRLADDQTGNQA